MVLLLWKYWFNLGDMESFVGLDDFFFGFVGGVGGNNNIKSEFFVL